MNRRERLYRHSLEVGGFRLGSPASAAPAADPEDEARVRAARLVRSARDAGKSSIVLFGLDSPQTARHAAMLLPVDMDLVVCEVDPERGRALLSAPNSPFSLQDGLGGPGGPGGRAALLCDDSDWAVFCLLRQAGLRPGACLTAMNVSASDPRRKKRLLGLRRLFDGSATVSVSAAKALPEAPSCDFAAILHPDEPDLKDFFRSIPACCERVVLVWDADAPPDAADDPALAGREVRHLARPLGGDFAAQRNLMLSACEAEWVFYLDADERPGPVMASLAPRLCALGLSGFYFPRMTFCPGPDRVRTGFGLWPDPQLRLFRRRGVRFERPAHERIAGLSGPLGLALWAPILHLSNLQKDAAALARKHAVFDEALGAGPLHRQNAVYPTLPLDFFEPPPDADPGEIAVLPKA